MANPVRPRHPSWRWLLLLAAFPAAVRGDEPAAAPLLASAGPSLYAAVPLPPPPSGTTAIPATLAAPAPAVAARTRGYRRFGLSLDVGVPNGASATLLYRPLKFLRLGGGLLYNYIGYGALASVSIQPHYWIAPSLAIEAGHYFDANALDKVAHFATVDDSIRPLLEQVGYSFVNAQAGFELGAPSTFVFFIRGGLSRVWLSVNNANQAAQAASASGGSRLTYVADPNVRLGIPSVKAGFMFYVY
ncbi:MAG TPA: hypothetical protein VMG32_10095 [Anaeromyxobacteraceae bacterium]|nr:hypothetical protein [Anaeromyxobacteraceae bacterium]